MFWIALVDFHGVRWSEKKNVWFKSNRSDYKNDNNNSDDNNESPALISCFERKIAKNMLFFGDFLKNSDFTLKMNITIVIFVKCTF